MFNKAVFKQTVKANRVLWFIVTAVLTLILTLIIFQFDPSTMQQLMNTLQGAGIGADVAGDSLLSNSITILGILSQSFYSMIAIIIMLVFIIITANNLIAGEVDRGSMAYTLSTPIKRKSVIFTKAVFLITSLLLMVTIFTTAGILSVQIKYQLIWGRSYTNDIKEIAKNTDDYTRAELDDDYNFIYYSDDLAEIGSKKRNVSVVTYKLYLQNKAYDRGITAAAGHLGIDMAKLDKNYDKILASSDAMQIGADTSKMGLTDFTLRVNAAKSSLDQSSDPEVEEKFKELFEEVYTRLGMTSAGAAIANLEKILEAEQVLKDVITDPVERFVFTTAIRNMSANQLLTQDKSITFDTGAFLKINAGLFLLMFATSGISFIASSIFNLTKNSFALGAGLPLGFWVLDIISNIDESLANAKYFSLNTLFNPSGLMTDSLSFIWKFVVLAVVGTGLYVASIYIFDQKDLPL